MSVSIEMVKDLREKTGAGVLEAKKALEATNGDFDRAYDILREKGALRAEKRSDRAAEEGIIEVYQHHNESIGVMVELNCETDFVARSEQFRTLAHDLALQVAAMNPRYLSPEDIPAAEIETHRAQLQEQALSEGKPADIAERIVAGRMNKLYEEQCLSEQTFVKDDERKVKDLVTEVSGATGENIIVRRFIRYELGETI